METRSSHRLAASLAVAALAAATFIVAAPAHATSDYLDEESEAAVTANLLDQGIDPATAAVLVAKLDGGTLLDSQTDAEPVSTELVDSGDSWTTVQVFADGSRQTASIEKPVEVTGEISPMAVTGCTRIVTGSAADYFADCLVRASDGYATLEFFATHTTPSLTVAGPYLYASITNIHSWGGTGAFATFSLTSFSRVRITATASLPALARLSVQVNWAGGTYALRLELLVPGTGSTHSSSIYSP